ncbi:MAG TPA: hypothetical protein VIY52_32610 [Streptosporangiaceae bacterium]
MTVTINDTTMTTHAPAVDTGSEPAATAGDWSALASEDQHPDGSGPRPTYVRSEPAPYALRVSDEPQATWDDPPTHAIGRKAGS